MRKTTESCGLDLDSIDAGVASDLRRRHTRALAEHVVRCARWAMPRERALVLGVYEEGLTAAQLARVSGEEARAVRRRVRKAVERFLSPRFVFVLAERDGWPARRRRVATACVLQGRTMRETATHLQTTLHVVRQEMRAVEALLEAAERSGLHGAGGGGGAGTGWGGPVARVDGGRVSGGSVGASAAVLKPTGT